MKSKARDAAVCGDELILLADRLVEYVYFDSASQFSELVRMEQLFAMGVQGLQQSGGEAPRGPQTGSGGDIRKRRNLYLRCLEIEYFYGFADDRVMNIFGLLHMLQLGVLQVDSRREWARNRNVHILVDRRCNQESLVAAVVRRQVRAPSPQCDAQWTTRDDHIRTPCKSFPRFPVPRRHRSSRPRAGAAGVCPQETPPSPFPRNRPPSETPRRSFRAAPSAEASCSNSGARDRSCRRAPRSEAFRSVRRVRTKRYFSTRCSSRAKTRLASSPSLAAGKRCRPQACPRNRYG